METKAHICFVANFYKTYFFHEIARKLQAGGVRVFWIVTNQKLYRFLCREYGAGNILYITRDFVHKTAEPVAELKINELLYGDRVLKHELHNGLRFLTNIQRPVYDFIEKNSIRLVFGEITWAHELLINRLVRARPELSCGYYDCSVVRIPNQRIAFFEGEDQGNMVEFNRPVEVKNVLAIEKPAYLRLNDALVRKSSSIRGRIDRIKRFITGENMDMNDPTLIVHKPTRMKVTSGEEYNRVAYRRIRTASFEEIMNERFIFFGFHKQPEASIDVSGRYNEDQEQLVLDFWRLLPHGWKLVIKEHTNAIGDRSAAFYRRLLKYPGIILASETVDSRLLIERSQLVVTVTGTMAYEAALMRKPAITLAPVYFNRISCCRLTSWTELVSYDSINTLIDELLGTPDNRLQFTAYLMSNSFEGYVSDSYTDPSVMSDENITKVQRAFEQLIIKRYREINQPVKS
jgi:hypothetical protein